MHDDYDYDDHWWDYDDGDRPVFCPHCECSELEHDRHERDWYCPSEGCDYRWTGEQPDDAYISDRERL